MTYLHLIVRAVERRNDDLARCLMHLALHHDLLTFDDWVEVGYLDHILFMRQRQTLS